MDKCECWELRKTIVGWHDKSPLYGQYTKQICNGTKEREECTCGGNVTECNFYPEKRKEGKTLNTAEMFIRANKDGKTYKCGGMRYNKEDGFYNSNNKMLWSAGSFNYVNDIFKLNWEPKPDNEMTKSEAEAKFNIKIVGN